MLFPAFNYLLAVRLSDRFADLCSLIVIGSTITRHPFGILSKSGSIELIKLIYHLIIVNDPDHSSKFFSKPMNLRKWV